MPISKSFNFFSRATTANQTISNKNLNEKNGDKNRNL